MQLSYDYAKDRALMCLRANYESHLCTWLPCVPSALRAVLPCHFCRCRFAAAFHVVVLPSGRWPFSTTAYGRCHVVPARVPAPRSSPMPLPARVPASEFFFNAFASLCSISAILSNALPKLSCRISNCCLSSRYSALVFLYSFLSSVLVANNEHAIY